MLARLNIEEQGSDGGKDQERWCTLQGHRSETQYRINGISLQDAGSSQSGFQILPVIPSRDQKTISSSGRSARIGMWEMVGCRAQKKREKD